MKSIALLSMVALMLTPAYFAPVAMAQEAGETDIQSVELGVGGTVTVTGTIECTEGLQYAVSVEVRQTQGNKPFNVGVGGDPDTGLANDCETTGPATFSATIVGTKPFKKGDALVTVTPVLCEPFVICRQGVRLIEEFRIR